jgi:hypothetical protein
MKRIPRITSSHLIAMLALFVALGGTAGAAGVKLITGSGIKNGSLTGVDIKRGSITGKQLRNGSITGLDIRDGTLRSTDFSAADLAQLVGAKGNTGATGAQGPAGAKGDTGAIGPQGATGAPATLQSVNTTGSDISGYQNGDAILTITAGAPGYYLAIASGTVTNTGPNDDYLNCGFDVSGTLAGAAGFSTTAGNASSGSSVTVVPTTNANETVKFVCFGSGGTTFDLANLKMKLIKLADQ